MGIFGFPYFLWLSVTEMLKAGSRNITLTD